MPCWQQPKPRKMKNRVTAGEVVVGAGEGVEGAVARRKRRQQVVMDRSRPKPRLQSQVKLSHPSQGAVARRKRRQQARMDQSRPKPPMQSQAKPSRPSEGAVARRKRRHQAVMDQGRPNPPLQSQVKPSHPSDLPKLASQAKPSHPSQLQCHAKPSTRSARRPVCQHECIGSPCANRR